MKKSKVHVKYCYEKLKQHFWATMVTAVEVSKLRVFVYTQERHVANGWHRKFEINSL